MIAPDYSSLEAAGLSPASAGRRAALVAACREVLAGPRPGAETVLLVPGRIEVLGKHTDYAGGRSLLCAADLGFVFVSRPRADRQVRVTAVPSGERFECPIDPAIEPQVGHWSNYRATVVRRVARNFPDAVTGVDIAFASDLPPAAGMSSSSAFMIGVFASLAAANGIEEHGAFTAAVPDRLALASYLATIENGRSFGALAGDTGVGTFGGSEDHTAILCCRPGHLSRYAFAPIRFEGDCPLGDDWTFVVASSGVLAEKTGAARERYNRASRLAADALAVWNEWSGRTDGSLEAAVSSEPGARDRLLECLRRRVASHSDGAEGLARVEQFCFESRDVVPAAFDALRRNDLDTFGAWVDRSQDAAERGLGNQVPETIFLARSARECGAAAASAFGAGFGGSVWALVRGDHVPDFVGRWRERYASAFPGVAPRALFVATRPGPPAFTLAQRAPDASA